MIVGFELTSHSIRAVAFERGRVGYAPDRFTEVPFSPDEDGLPGADALREAVRGLGENAELIALATPADWCHYRTVRFPYKSAGRIESTLKYAVEGRVPGPIEEYTVEPLGAPREDADGASLYVAACRTARLTRLLERFRSAGIDPAAVMPVPSALVSSADRLKGRSLIARKGPDGIDLALCDEGRLAAAGRIAVTETESGLARAGDEVRRTVELWCAAGGLARPERICLIAAGEEASLLSAALREATGLPVERAEVDERVAAAWGAAKEAVEKKSAAVSLRRGGLAYQPYAQRLEKRVAAALVLSAVLLAVVGFGAIRKINEVADVLRQVSARQSDLYREVTGAPGPVNTIAMRATLETERKAAAQRGGAGVSCLRRWIDLMNLLPKEGDFVFSNLNFSQSGVTFTATAGKGAAAWELNNRITASQVFERDEAFRVDERMTDGRVKFTMELKYK
jgi:type II secretion system protein L